MAYTQLQHFSKYLLVLCMTAGGAFAQPSSSVQVVPTTGNPSLPSVESKLGSCQGDNPRNGNMCIGSFTFPNGNSYNGEWRNGQRDGVGRMRIVAKGKSSQGYIGSATPSVYVGEFKGNMLNGHGVWVVDGGDRYEGEFINNILIQVSQNAVNSFGNDSEKFRKKCESYGLQFGSGDFAKCMMQLEQMSAVAAQNEADRSQRDKESRRAAEADASRQSLDAFKAMGEIAKPQWIPNQCPQMLNARPGQYPGCN